MKAVFSYYNTTGNVLQPRHYLNSEFFLLSWALSTNLAKKQFEEVELVTDSESAKIFEKLQLPVTIRTELDNLNYNKTHWALGKIKAYQIQDKPFIHIDDDVFLFSNLEERIKNAPIAFQNKEENEWFDNCYKQKLTYLNEISHPNYAVNMGLYLCNDLEFNKKYCKQVFDFVNKHNVSILKSSDAGYYSMVFEQFIAAKVIEELKIIPEFISKNNIKEEYLRQKYVHIWGAKKNGWWLDKVKERVQLHYPNYIEIINELIK